MRPSCPSGWSAAIVALAIATLADARSATLKDKARLRAAPGAASELLGEIPAGASVDITGDSGGWRQVRTADGQTGYVWSDHLIEGDAQARPQMNPLDAAPPSTGPRTTLDEVRALRDDVSALRDRPAPATAAEVERLRVELERLASAQQLIARRLDERLIPAADSPPPEAPLAGLGPLVFILGGGFGWVLSRLFQRRRDHRQRNRIRI